MYHINASLVIEEGHPAYEWAKKQSDSVNAFGHIGTHIDCYDKIPAKHDYTVDAVVVDCREGMPTRKKIDHLDIAGKALVLFTGNLDNNGYGTPQYGNMQTSLQLDVLDHLLSMSPAFIVIDSYGIGNHGEEHIRFDRACEARECFVVENVMLSQRFIPDLKQLKISFDHTSASTGKRCCVIAVCDDH